MDTLAQNTMAVVESITTEILNGNCLFICLRSKGCVVFNWQLVVVVVGASDAGDSLMILSSLLPKFYWNLEAVVGGLMVIDED